MPDIGKLQGARNGRGRKVSTSTIFFQGFELFLVAHAEALLLVQHQQGQIGQFHVAGKNTVGADENVDLPAAAALSTSFCRGLVTKRLNSPTLTGKPARRARKVW